MKTIKLDIDKKEISISQVNRIIKVKYLLGLDILDVRITKSHSGNYHIEMDILNNINDLELIIIQAVMGSDFKRECFNLLRVHSGKFKNQDWNILFKKKIKMPRR